MTWWPGSWSAWWWPDRGEDRGEWLPTDTASLAKALPDPFCHHHHSGDTITIISILSPTASSSQKARVLQYRGKTHYRWNNKSSTKIVFLKSLLLFLLCRIIHLFRLFHQICDKCHAVIGLHVFTTLAKISGRSRKQRCKELYSTFPIVLAAQRSVIKRWR